MKKRHLAVLAIAMIMVSYGCSGGGQAEAEGWLPFNEGIELAAKTGRPVIIDFYTSWCKWCKVMDRETFSDPEVKKFLEKNFITIRIDAENRTDKLNFQGKVFTPAELTRAMRVTVYPSLAYMESDGKVIMVIPGFKKPAEFMPNLKYVKDGCYRNNVTLDEYKSGKDCGGGA